MTEPLRHAVYYVCYFCGTTGTTYYPPQNWCYDCAMEISEMSKDNPRPKISVSCKQCETFFETRHPRKIFCDHICACAWHNKVNRHAIAEYRKLMSDENVRKQEMTE